MLFRNVGALVCVRAKVVFHRSTATHELQAVRFVQCKRLRGCHTLPCAAGVSEWMGEANLRSE